MPVTSRERSRRSSNPPASLSPASRKYGDSLRRTTSPGRERNSKPRHDTTHKVSDLGRKQARGAQIRLGPPGGVREVGAQFPDARGRVSPPRVSAYAEVSTATATLVIGTRQQLMVTSTHHVAALQDDVASANVRSVAIEISRVVPAPSAATPDRRAHRNLWHRQSRPAGTPASAARAESLTGLR